MRTKIKPMPVFDADAARAQLGDQRFEQALRDPRSVELLTWNVFHTLESHDDTDWLAYRLQMFGGTDVAPPVRLQLWTGRETDPLLEPSRGYLRQLRERGASAGASEDVISEFKAPMEVGVRIECPDVLCLIDTMMDSYDRGTEGRDRILQLIDAGMEHARRLSKTLAVTVLYRSGSAGAQEVSQRMGELRGALAEELPHQGATAKVQLRDMGWQQVLKVWESEIDYLTIDGSPRAFLAHCRGVGLL